MQAQSNLFEVIYIVKYKLFGGFWPKPWFTEFSRKKKYFSNNHYFGEI